ncbi:hypothetical protein KR100_13430 [Synechococcus sp. KORDI-100]|nr:hypothetical protein KR100_13430 [Synechococcus sp. KORDI-100]
MDGQTLEFKMLGPLNQATEMVHVAVDTTIGAKPQQVQSATAGVHSLNKRSQGRRLDQLVVGDGITDPHKLLTDDPTGADRQVSDLGVAHLLIRQTNVSAAGFDQGVGIGMPERIHHRRLSLKDGVVLSRITVAPAVEDGENDGRCRS